VKNNKKTNKLSFKITTKPTAPILPTSKKHFFIKPSYKILSKQNDEKVV